MRSLLLLHVFCWSSQACKTSQHKPQTGSMQQRFQSGKQQFTNRLLQQIKSNTTTNFVLSPHSIYSVFSYLLHGSGGQTKAELENLLGVTASVSLVEQYRILGESGEGFKQAYPNRFNSRFNFDDVNGDPRGVFVNAVYFKADWQFAFNVHLTYRAKFNLAKGHSIDAQFMGSIANVRVLDVARRKLRILELPYEHPDRSMLIVLPDEETSTENLAKRLQGLDFTNIRTDEEPSETYISIPKFEFKFKTDLKEHMEQLGVRDLFSEASADLSGISNEHLFASQGVHQALIKVNEEGTEAQWPKAGVVSRLHKQGLRMHLGRQKAAAAAVAMFYKSGSRWLNQLFIADRPFLFVVYDFEHKMTLFAGKVADPNKTGVVQS